MQGTFGKLTIINIYDNSKKWEIIPALTTFLDRESHTIHSSPTDHLVLLGDFNAHHHLWEEARNTHLCTLPEAQETAQQIIELMADHDLQMALPRDKPTLQSTSSGNWTRPDNVFCTTHTLDSFTLCDTAPRRHPPCTDHVPIYSTLDLPIPRASTTITFNFQDVDWDEFHGTLRMNLAKFPEPVTITSEEQFQAATANLKTAISTTIKQKVPKTKQSPHMKRWWTKELTLMMKQKNKLSDISYRMRGLPEHPSHEEHRCYRNQVTEAIRKTKHEHWIDYLEELDQESVYNANHYITTPYGDEGRSSVPVLKVKNEEGNLIEAITNDEKSKALANAFFPPPPDNSSIPPDYDYPDPITPFTRITEEQIARAISNTSSYKAPGPDGICNIVFKRASAILTPYLRHLFNAVFTLNTYFDPWREFTTVVLKKPGKADYTTPKAYRPIALINTMCKLLTAIIAERVSDLVEHHNLLPNTHFKG